MTQEGFTGVFLNYFSSRGSNFEFWNELVESAPKEMDVEMLRYHLLAFMCQREVRPVFVSLL